MAYFRQPQSIENYVNMLLSGTALMLGGETPNGMKPEFLQKLTDAGEKGTEVELLAVKPTVDGGQWLSDDKDKPGAGYIGNISAILQIGTVRTVAKLSPADLIQFRKNENKAVCKRHDTPSKDGKRQYNNVVCVKPIVVDRNDATIIAILKGLVDFAKTTADVTA